MSRVIFFLLIFSVTVVCAEELPTFVSVRGDEVNMRTGPAERFPVRYIYQEKHLPLQVLDYIDGWYQVRESDGTIGWINKVMLSKERFVFIPMDTHLLEKADSDTLPVALIQQGTIGKLEKCPKNSDFCKIRFDQIEGWLQKSKFWGVHLHEVID